MGRRSPRRAPRQRRHHSASIELQYQRLAFATPAQLDQARVVRTVTDHLPGIEALLETEEVERVAIQEDINGRRLYRAQALRVGSACRHNSPCHRLGWTRG